MKRKLLGAFGAFAAGASLSFGQSLPAPTTPAILPIVQAEPAKDAPTPAKDAPKVDAPANEAVPAQILMEAPAVYFEDYDSAPQTRIWGGAEYLLWWLKDSPLPVPVALSMPAEPEAGIIPPGSTVALGGAPIDQGLQQGGRFSLGANLGADGVFSVDANYFFIASHTENQSVSSSGAAGGPFIGAPNFNTFTGDNRIGPTSPTFVATIAGPGAPGTFGVNLTSQLDGAELNAAINFGRGNLRFALLGGFRYFSLEEDLLLTRSGNSFLGQFIIFPVFVNLGPIRAFDAFNCRNEFFGGQFGARVEYDTGRVFVRAAAKLALGDMNQRTAISGNYVFPAPGGTVFPGATFAQPTNIGDHNSSDFSVIPEVTINAGVNVGRFARAFVGYNFLYASNVLRPGNQIDTVINPLRTAQFPFNTGPVRPAYVANPSGFWAQGINLGLEFRY